MTAFLSFKVWHSVVISTLCAAFAVAIILLGVFLFNCLRWRDLGDPPRRLKKWKQRQRIAEDLRSERPGIVSLYLYHGVKDAEAFADDIREAFESAGWKVVVEDDDLEGEPEHMHGLWVYGHSNQTEETAKKREFIAAAFNNAAIPITVDRRVNLSGSPHPSIVIGHDIRNKVVRE